MERKRKIRFLVEGALIAAAYAGLTLAGIGFSYGALQFRIAEILTVLPIFTPAAIPGLAVGCFIANIASFNAADMVFGTLATLLAAVVTYLLRNVCIKRIPLLSLLSPVVFNAVIIGLELYMLSATPWGFGLTALSVGASEFIICVILGIPTVILLKKYNIFDKSNLKK
ncbi:MAG: QueT transporter family protein [Clostridia bacterium]|nr:QueT transporter family protein [Clostridia bacterium]